MQPDEDNAPWFARITRRLEFRDCTGDDDDNDDENDDDDADDDRVCV